MRGLISGPVSQKSELRHNLNLGVGDGKNEIFNSVRYSAAKADFFDDKNMEPGPICTQPKPCDWHPRIDSVVYHGMDWNCPTFTSVLGEQIQKFYGQLTPEVIISDVIAKVYLELCLTSQF